MNKSKSVGILLIVFLSIAMLGFLTVFGLGEQKIGSAKEIKRGMDLSGGLSITYETDSANPSDKDMNDTVQKVQKRLEFYKIQSKVYRDGTNGVTITIPEVDDAEGLLKDIGKKGSMECVAPGNSEGDAGEALLTESDIKSAKVKVSSGSTAGTKEYFVALTLTDEGKENLSTSAEQSSSSQIAVMYNESQIGNLLISDGEYMISGMDSYAQAKELATLLQIGSLPRELNEAYSGTITPTLGANAMKMILIAGVVGISLIMIVMIFMFMIPGIAASLALLLYSVLLMFVLYALDITMTLPGIAGIILSIAMVVNSVVIIISKIMHEFSAGKSTRLAVKDGYRKAFPAVLDGNIIILIVALVIAFKGSVNISGFGQVLAIGSILTMFTSFFVTKYILKAFYELGYKKEKLYKIRKEIKTINIIGKKKVCFIISGLIIIAGFLAMGINYSGGRGILKYSMESVGGTSTSVVLNKNMSMKELNKIIVPLVSDITGDNNIQIQKDKKADDQKNIVIIKTGKLETKEKEKLQQALAKKFDVNDMKVVSGNTTSTVTEQEKRDVMISFVIAMICMLLYIGFRFKDIRLVFSTFITLIHDLLIILSVFAVFRIQADTVFIATLLVAAGYSIYSSIGILDRIRENTVETKTEENLEEIVKRCINQTFTRNIYPLISIFVLIVIMLIIGVASIKIFAALLMVVIICGCYSSACLNGSLWYQFKNKRIKSDKE